MIVETNITTDTDWGLCDDCKWWQIEPEAEVSDHTLGLCVDEDLQPFRLRVSGVNVCKSWEAGRTSVATTKLETDGNAARHGDQHF